MPIPLKSQKLLLKFASRRQLKAAVTAQFLEKIIGVLFLSMVKRSSAEFLLREKLFNLVKPINYLFSSYFQTLCYQHYR